MSKTELSDFNPESLNKLDLPENTTLYEGTLLEIMKRCRQVE